MSFKMKRTLEMRRVESAFADYLENEDSIDLLWSDKVGYVFLTINEKTHQSESCEDLHTAPQLCRRLLDDMAIGYINSILPQPTERRQADSKACAAV